MIVAKIAMFVYKIGHDCDQDLLCLCLRLAMIVEIGYVCVLDWLCLRPIGYVCCKD